MGLAATGGVFRTRLRTSGCRCERLEGFEGNKKAGACMPRPVAIAWSDPSYEAAFSLRSICCSTPSRFLFSCS
jgi:hypothetical protein